MSIIVDVKASSGNTIQEVIEDMIVLSNKIDTKVQANFNGVMVVVTKSSDITHLIEDYEWELKRREI